MQRPGLPKKTKPPNPSRDDSPARPSSHQSSRRRCHAITVAIGPASPSDSTDAAGPRSAGRNTTRPVHDGRDARARQQDGSRGQVPTGSRAYCLTKLVAVRGAGRGWPRPPGRAGRNRPPSSRASPASRSHACRGRRREPAGCRGVSFDRFRRVLTLSRRRTRS